MKPRFLRLQDPGQTDMLNLVIVDHLDFPMAEGVTEQQDLGELSVSTIYTTKELLINSQRSTYTYVMWPR